MAEKKRQCGTCRFFVESDTGGHGKCTHPRRDTALREMVLLRPNELGCRTRWGTSLWQDPTDERDPTVPEVPQQPALPEPLVASANTHYDDEVTSVSIAGSTSTRPVFDDDVVDSGAVATGLGSWNDSIQEERRRLMIHGERDALAGARKRHMEKQTRQRELIPFADENTDPPANDAVDKPAADGQEPELTSRPSFPADDYVEDERSADADVPASEDALVDEGVHPGGSRSPRGRRLMRETKSPKDHKAMTLGLPAEMSVTSHNPEHREQWNSVPAVTPGFELPLVTTHRARPTTPLRMSASAAPVMSMPAPARPVSQARELVTGDRLRQQRARRHVEVPLADDQLPLQPETDLHRQPVTNRPRLTQAPARQAPQVDRLKTSPLRGYHPAVKATARLDASAQAPHQQPARTKPDADEPQQQLRQPARQPAARTNPEHQPVPGRHEPASQGKGTAVNHPEQLQRRPLAPTQPVRELTPFTRTPIALAPKVPRACSTCTSFRPSGVEGRGSCANAFAGPVQRVVHADDLACQHTFGSFWLPADENVWLDELVDHEAETPRVNRMIARRKQRTHPVLPDLEELTS